MKKLYPVQEAHADVLTAAIMKWQSALDASDTGTGKTIIAAALASRVTNPVHVIAPKSLIPMWKRELGEHGIAAPIINYEMLRRGNTGFGGWKNGQWKWTVPDDALLIWDEVQKCKSPDSQNGRMLMAAKPYFNLCLSATAAESPAEMRSLGFVLGLHKLLNWWPWARARGCFVNRWGKLQFNDDIKQLEILHKEIFPDHGHRLRVADLKDHFTETQIITTPLDFGGKVSKLYAEMETELAKLADTMKSDSTHPAAQRLVVTLRARQSVELCKVPLILEMIDDLVAEGRSVAVFLNFDASLEAIRERCPYTCAIVRGGQSETERSGMIEVFQENKVPVVLCNIQAGGLGISLHDLQGDHPRTAIISPSWSAFDVIQALGRVHRAGGCSATQQHVLFAAGTIEETVERVVRRKIENISVLNDGKD